MRRRLLIFLGTGFVVFAIAAGAFNLLALGAQHTVTARSSYTGVRSLVVNSLEGDVHLTGAPAGSPLVVVEHVSESLETPDRHTVRPSPDALRLSYSCAAAVLHCSVGYDISVPANVWITVRTITGDVEATGIATPRADLESGTGDISATFSRPAGSLRATDGVGDIRLVVPDVRYAVNANSGVGDVREQSLRTDPRSPRLIDVSSGTGDVTITAAQP